jgi:tRNA pseudouridine55 synthase
MSGRNSMDGIINVLKPPGMTSFDVVAYIRKRAGGAKTGHAGTLDPAAAGVLPVCVGKATRLVEYMNEMRKLYRAEMLLGQETDTQDGTGRVVSEKPVNVSRDQVEEALNGFIGVSEQIPPMYSAVKVDGKKLYELARKGETVRRKARKIEVYGINIVDIYDNRVLFDIECSRGTYIRTICHDAGRELGCGAHMKFLLRKRVGPFTLENAHTLEELRDIGENSLLSPDEAVKHFDKVIMPNNEAGLLINGRSVQLNGYKGSTGLVRVYNESGLFLAVGEVDRKGRILKPRKVFYGGDKCR